jgi:hypothetical protein
MEVINPQLKEVERKVEDLRDTVFQMRGEIDAIKHNTRDLTRQTIWQFVIFTVTMGAILLGGIKYQTDTLRNEMNLRFDAQQRETSARFEALEQRVVQSEKNITARFEDLKQEVRANRK